MQAVQLPTSPDVPVNIHSIHRIHYYWQYCVPVGGEYADMMESQKQGKGERRRMETKELVRDGYTKMQSGLELHGEGAGLTQRRADGPTLIHTLISTTCADGQICI